MAPIFDSCWNPGKCPSLVRMTNALSGIGASFLKCLAVVGVGWHFRYGHFKSLFGVVLMCFCFCFLILQQ